MKPCWTERGLVGRGECRGFREMGDGAQRGDFPVREQLFQGEATRSPVAVMRWFADRVEVAVALWLWRRCVVLELALLD